MATLYTLITVTYGGEVSHSRGYETLRMCQQAKSLALTGMTIEENEAADAAYAARIKKWEDEHPWREPKDDWERKLVASGTWGGYGDGHRTISYRDGKLREGYPHGGMSMSYNPNSGESVVHVRGDYVLKHRHDVKYAECFIEPGVPVISGEPDGQERGHHR